LLQKAKPRRESPQKRKTSSNVEQRRATSSNVEQRRATSSNVEHHRGIHTVSSDGALGDNLLQYATFRSKTRCNVVFLHVSLNSAVFLIVCKVFDLVCSLRNNLGVFYMFFVEIRQHQLPSRSFAGFAQDFVQIQIKHPEM
jgi:hypothetical protein